MKSVAGMTTVCPEGQDALFLFCNLLKLMAVVEDE